MNSMRISNEVANYIESLDYEISARKELISFMIKNNIDVDGDAFKKYHEELVEYIKEFNLAKKELEESIKHNFKTDETYPNGFNWTLDYRTALVTVSEMNNVGECKCCQ